MTTPTFAGATTHFGGREQFLLFITAEDPSACGSLAWFEDHKLAILDALDRFGVVYFRGFGPDSHGFEAIADLICPATMPYGGGVSPRRFVHGTVFTANDAPGPLPVVQHHELAYHGTTPRYVFFYCDHPPERGGATPVADGRRVGRTMATRCPAIMDALERKGVVFVRNYCAANFKGWQETWQTEDRAELEDKLRANDTEFEWLADDWLRTLQRRHAIVRDPVSGERLVFATVNIWSRSFVECIATVYDLPAPESDDWSLPFNTLYGDGSPIPPEFVDELARAHDEEMITIPYAARDFMIVNNFVASHGRTPWSGPDRRVYVTMRDPIHHSKLGQIPRR